MDSQTTSIKGSIQILMSLNRILYVFEKHVGKDQIKRLSSYNAQEVLCWAGDVGQDLIVVRGSHGQFRMRDVYQIVVNLMFRNEILHEKRIGTAANISNRLAASRVNQVFKKTSSFGPARKILKHIELVMWLRVANRHCLFTHGNKVIVLTWTTAPGHRTQGTLDA